MITRRKLLAFLGLGGAATAVASKVEAEHPAAPALKKLYEGDVLLDEWASLERSMQRRDVSLGGGRGGKRYRCAVLPVEKSSALPEFDPCTERTAEGVSRVEARFGWLSQPRALRESIDPSTFPRVRVRPFVQFGADRWSEYRLARAELLSDLLGAPIFLGADGLARLSTSRDAITLVGVCDEVLTCVHNGREHIVRRWSAADMPHDDGTAWVRIGGKR